MADAGIVMTEAQRTRKFMRAMGLKPHAVFNILQKTSGKYDNFQQIFAALVWHYPESQLVGYEKRGEGKHPGQQRRRFVRRKSAYMLDRLPEELSLIHI